MDKSDILDFGLIGIANLLPLVGYFLFDLEFMTLGLLYWFDVVALLLVYSGYAMFAQSESTVEERESTLLPGTIGDGYWSEAPRSIARSLPPIYTRNLRVVLPTVLFVTFVVVVFGASGLAGDPDLGIRGGAGDIAEFLSAFSAFTSPVVFGVGLGILGTHVVTIHRRYIRSKRYEELSAYMTLELPVRFILVYVLSLPLVLFYSLSVSVLTGSILPTWGFDVLWAGSFLAVKLGLEWGRYRAEQMPDPGGYAAWFTPSEPSETIELSGRVALGYVATFAALLVVFLILAFSTSG
ncbi:hypothetical protein [Halorussus amylolyticus]|uniref:hypothetical protein n=1 Tax=Halorussus amylolyticus TaxID=1126242 RepID=UPI001042C040|nr:hypothetical protein [Halorussus amylolyticus]